MIMPLRGVMKLQPLPAREEAKAWSISKPTTTPETRALTRPRQPSLHLASLIAFWFLLSSNEAPDNGWKQGSISQAGAKRHEAGSEAPRSQVPNECTTGLVDHLKGEDTANPPQPILGAAQCSQGKALRPVFAGEFDVHVPVSGQMPPCSLPKNKHTQTQKQICNWMNQAVFDQATRVQFGLPQPARGKSCVSPKSGLSLKLGLPKKPLSRLSQWPPCPDTPGKEEEEEDVCRNSAVSTS